MKKALLLTVIAVTFCVSDTIGVPRCAPGSKWARAKQAGGRHGCRHCLCLPSREWICYSSNTPCRLENIGKLTRLDKLEVDSLDCPQCVFIYKSKNTKAQTTETPLNPSTTPEPVHKKEKYEYTIVQSGPVGSYMFYKAPADHIFQFEVRTTSDSYVYLTTGPVKTASYIEICIGCNKKIQIKLGSKVVNDQCPFDVLDMNAYVGFWIRWTDDRVFLGRGNESLALCMGYVDKMFPVTHVGLYSKIDNTAWRVQGVETQRHISSNLKFPAPIDRKLHFEVKKKGNICFTFYKISDIQLWMDWSNEKTVFHPTQKGKKDDTRKASPSDNLMDDQWWKAYWLSDKNNIIQIGREYDDKPYQSYDKDEEYSFASVDSFSVHTVDLKNFLKIPLSQFEGAKMTIVPLGTTVFVSGNNTEERQIVNETF